MSLIQKVENEIDDSQASAIKLFKCGITFRSKTSLICTICEEGFDLSHLKHHLSQSRHKENYSFFMTNLMLIQLPTPSSNHYKSLSSLLEKTYLDFSLSSQDIINRNEQVNKLELKLKSFLHPKSHLRIYGSSATGFGLKSSNINIELNLENFKVSKSSQILQKVFNQFERDPEIDQLKKDFSSSVPQMSFSTFNSSKSQKYPFVLTFKVETSLKTSFLLEKYSTFDERVKPLGVCLRIFGQTFGYDIPNHSTWPPHVFSIFVIYFLQNCDPPVIPCIHEHIEVKSLSKNVTFKDLDLAYQKLASTWKSFNNKSLGQLWIELLRFYLLEFNHETEVLTICKTRKNSIPVASKAKVIFIEDPFRPNVNLSRSVAKPFIFQAFKKDLTNCFHYFSIPSFKNSFLFDIQDFHLTSSFSPSSLPKDYFLASYFQENIKLNEKGRKRKFKINRSIDYHAKIMKIFQLKMELNPQKYKEIDELTLDHFQFTFNFHKLGFYATAPKYCRLCTSHNHLPKDCMIDAMPPLIKIPVKLCKSHRERLDAVCLQLFNKKKITAHSEWQHQNVIKDLEQFLSTHFSSTRLDIFGSCTNGFGANGCDIDICFRFSYDLFGKQEHSKQIKLLKQISKSLQVHPNVQNVTAITQAKVPIVKLDYKFPSTNRTTVHKCDISLYNLLALCNTQLLHTYSQIDSRVRVLGLTVKRFAKICDISDASKGSLSSYSYILMTLYYLQQCNPPVIPVLQELCPEELTEIIVDDWNVAYFSDISRLSNVWPHLNKNKDSIGDLFFGFLRYYNETFSFEDDVVCIRKLEKLTKVDKGWTNRKIAIEDPFQLDFNLGAGITKRMAAFIRTCFILAQNMIASQPDSLPTGYKNWENYFFDPHYITLGNIPVSRGCSNCRKIGHKMINCPLKNSKKQNAHELTFDNQYMFNQNKKAHENLGHSPSTHSNIKGQKRYGYNFLTHNKNKGQKKGNHNHSSHTIMKNQGKKRLNISHIANAKSQERIGYNHQPHGSSIKNQERLNHNISTFGNIQSSERMSHDHDNFNQEKLNPNVSNFDIKSQEKLAYNLNSDYKKHEKKAFFNTQDSEKSRRLKVAVQSEKNGQDINYNRNARKMRQKNYYPTLVFKKKS